jgi:hypothetical protein
VSALCLKKTQSLLQHLITWFRASHPRKRQKLSNQLKKQTQVDQEDLIVKYRMLKNSQTKYSILMSSWRLETLSRIFACLRPSKASLKREEMMVQEEVMEQINNSRDSALPVTQWKKMILWFILMASFSLLDLVTQTFTSRSALTSTLRIQLSLEAPTTHGTPLSLIPQLLRKSVLDRLYST